MRQKNDLVAYFWDIPLETEMHNFVQNKQLFSLEV